MLYPAELRAHGRFGGYYARAYANGKEVRRSLKTKHLSVAESRLAEVLKSHRDTAVSDMSRQQAYDITFGLERADVGKIEAKDRAGIKSRKSAEFRYLRSDGENGGALLDLSRSAFHGRARHRVSARVEIFEFVGPGIPDNARI